jgi:hypothetical protein
MMLANSAFYRISPHPSFPRSSLLANAILFQLDESNILGTCIFPFRHTRRTPLCMVRHSQVRFVVP